MSLRTVKNLIKATPIDLIGDPGHNALVMSRAAERVLKLYQESKQYDLTDKERDILKQRLLEAARTLNAIIENEDELGSRRPKYQKNIRALHQRIFAGLAKELGMSVQALQAKI